MARPLPIEYQGAPCRVTGRCSERAEIFFSRGDYEFKERLSRLVRRMEDYGCFPIIALAAKAVIIP